MASGAEARLEAAHQESSALGAANAEAKQQLEALQRSMQSAEAREAELNTKVRVHACGSCGGCMLKVLYKLYKLKLRYSFFMRMQCKQLDILLLLCELCAAPGRGRC